jgi:hypothetical protein
MATRSSRAAWRLSGFALLIMALTPGEPPRATGTAEPHGPYSGRVVDATTGQPLAGAGVFVFWEYETAQASPRTHAFREARTNERGEFLVHSAGIDASLPPRSLPPTILVFQPGYRHYPDDPQQPRGAPARLFARPGSDVRLAPVTGQEARMEAASDFFTAVKTGREHGPLAWELVQEELRQQSRTPIDREANARRQAPAGESGPCVTDPRKITPAPAGGWPRRDASGRFIDGYHGPYRGRVVDAETGLVIPGAVVVLVWSRVVATIVQSNTYFYEACEVLTDANGEFVIDPRTVESDAPSKVLRPYLDAFHPGYASVRSPVFRPRGSITGTLADTEVRIALPRLSTREERLRAIESFPDSSVPDGRLPNATRLLNAERRNLDLRPVR